MAAAHPTKGTLHRGLPLPLSRDSGRGGQGAPSGPLRLPGTSSEGKEPCPPLPPAGPCVTSIRCICCPESARICPRSRASACPRPPCLCPRRPSPPPQHMDPHTSISLSGRLPVQPELLWDKQARLLPTPQPPPTLPPPPPSALKKNLNEMKQNKMDEGGRGERNGALFIFYFSCWGMPVLTWLRKSPQIRHGFQAGSTGIAVRQLVPRLSPAGVPGSLCRLYHPARAGGGGGGGGKAPAPASRRASRRQNARSLGRWRPPLSLRCRPGWGRGHRRTREGRGEGAF